uniref:Uncharacterized protein n=1 Tax=Desertifilum tharense IPPAS B-1220 TaxID=1781255 RepID=A0ACD5GTR4_9CYAN
MGKKRQENLITINSPHYYAEANATALSTLSPHPPTSPSPHPLPLSTQHSALFPPSPHPLPTQHSKRYY